jgi:hypothetical protein
MNSNAKKALKSIVRECLMEILSEGLGENLNESIRSKPKNAVNRTVSKTNQPVSKQATNSVSSKLHEVVALATDDELMRSILMDTAQTTLQEQLRNELPNYRNDAVQVAAQTDNGVDINDLFHEASSNWNAISQRINGDVPKSH